MIKIIRQIRFKLNCWLMIRLVLPATLPQADIKSAVFQSVREGFCFVSCHPANHEPVLIIWNEIPFFCWKSHNDLLLLILLHCTCFQVFHSIMIGIYSNTVKFTHFTWYKSLKLPTHTQKKTGINIQFIAIYTYLEYWCSILEHHEQYLYNLSQQLPFYLI